MHIDISVDWFNNGIFVPLHTKTPDNREIYLYWDRPMDLAIVGRRGGFEYRINRRAMDRAIINAEKRLRRDLMHEEIYQLAKIESQYIEFEPV